MMTVLLLLMGEKAIGYVKAFHNLGRECGGKRKERDYLAPLLLHLSILPSSVLSPLIPNLLHLLNHPPRSVRRETLDMCEDVVKKFFQSRLACRHVGMLVDWMVSEEPGSARIVRVFDSLRASLVSPYVPKLAHYLTRPLETDPWERQDKICWPGEDVLISLTLAMSRQPDEVIMQHPRVVLVTLSGESWWNDGSVDARWVGELRSLGQAMLKRIPAAVITPHIRDLMDRSMDQSYSSSVALPPYPTKAIREYLSTCDYDQRERFVHWMENNSPPGWKRLWNSYLQEKLQADHFPFMRWVPKLPASMEVFQGHRIEQMNFEAEKWGQVVDQMS